VDFLSCVVVIGSWGCFCGTAVFVLVIDDLSHAGFPCMMFVFLAVPKTLFCLKPKATIEKRK